MKLTGQCKEDFEKWLCNNHTPIWREYLQHKVDRSNWIPFSAWYGVLVDFFDSKDLKIELKHNVVLNDFGFIISGYGSFLPKENTHGDYHVYQNTDCDGEALKTRHQAREEVIKAANDIYNEKS